MNEQKKTVELTPDAYQKLTNRIEFLENLNRRNFSALDIISQLNAAESHNRTPISIFTALKTHLDHLIYFETFSFFTVDEDDSSFVLNYCSDENAIDSINMQKSLLIENGMFAWALSQNRVVSAEHSDNTKVILLHALVTKSRVRGIFFAVISKNKAPQPSTLHLLSLILQYTAYMLENSELYSIMQEQNTRLETHNKELESIVKQRTHSLVLAAESEKQANQTKSQFLANMSHEIRTPMNAIINFSELILQDEISSIHREYLEHISHSGGHLLQVINDILDFSKIEANKLNIENAPFKLEKLISELQVISTIPANEKNLNLRFLMPDALSNQLLGDPLRLKQVLINLINNAIKFTHQGGVTVTIDVLKQDSNAVELKFSIIDTGIGISIEQQNNLFKTFSQADISTTRIYGGSGLGLAICKQLVELMLGTINVSSDLGKGSTFSFILPFTIAAQKTENLQNTHNNDSFKEQLLNRPSIKVLLVEDNKTNQLLASRILKKVNITPDIANNGQEAIDMLTSQDYDLVFMDLQMPVMDGYTATKALRNNSKWAKLPIIAMTANAMSDVGKKCLSIGMNDYISKPIQIDTLYQKIIEWT